MNRQHSTSSPLFVIHKHHAHSLHYDLRLQEEGVLKSWAIPKGPSTDPTVKRLAIKVPDHELSYANFEGIIQEGYGAGSVLLWDEGTFDVVDSSHSLSDSLQKGKVILTFKGKKLQGRYLLIRAHLPTPHSWLFFKLDDEYARPDYSITDSEPYSVLSGKTIEQLTNEQHR